MWIAKLNQIESNWIKFIDFGGFCAKMCQESIVPWEAELVPEANGSSVSWVNDMLDSWTFWKQLRIAPRELAMPPVHCNSGDKWDKQTLVMCRICIDSYWLCVSTTCIWKLWKLCCPLTPTYPTYWRPSKEVPFPFRVPAKLVPAVSANVQLLISGVVSCDLIPHAQQKTCACLHHVAFGFCVLPSVSRSGTAVEYQSE